MTSLVLLEFDAAGIKQPSRSAVAAAQKLGEVHALVAGTGVRCGRRGCGEAARRGQGADRRFAGAGSPAGRADRGAAGRAGAGLFAPAGRHHGGRQEHHAARRRAAGRAADQRHRRRGRCRHLRPADLCRQRHGDGEVVRREEGDHRARRQLRSGAGRGRQRADRAGVDPGSARRCRASSRPSCRRASARS